VARGLDVRDALRVAADGDGRAQGGDAHGALRRREARAEGEAEEVLGDGKRHEAGGAVPGRPAASKPLSDVCIQWACRASCQQDWPMDPRSLPADPRMVAELIATVRIGGRAPRVLRSASTA